MHGCPEKRSITLPTSREDQLPSGALCAVARGHGQEDIGAYLAILGEDAEMRNRGTRTVSVHVILNMNTNLCTSPTTSPGRMRICWTTDPVSWSHCSLHRPVTSLAWSYGMAYTPSCACRRVENALWTRAQATKPLVDTTDCG